MKKWLGGSLWEETTAALWLQSQMNNILSPKQIPSIDKNFLQELAPPNRTKGFVIDKVKSDYLYQFPSYFLTKIWNDVNMFQKNKTSQNSFKDSLYSSFISKYPPAVKCKDRSCPDCFPTIIYLRRWFYFALTLSWSSPSL